MEGGDVERSVNYSICLFRLEISAHTMDIYIYIHMSMVYNGIISIQIDRYKLRLNLLLHIYIYINTHVYVFTVCVYSSCPHVLGKSPDASFAHQHGVFQ